MIPLRLAFALLLRWSTRRHGALLLGIAATVAGAVTLSDTSALLLVLGLASTLYGGVEVVRTLRDDLRRVHELYERERPVLLDAAYEPPYDTWQHVELRSWRAVTDPRLNHRLRAEQQIAIELAGERWRPAPKHLAELQQLRRMRIDFDDAKVRLASDLLASSTAVVLQRTDYSAFLVTNKLGIVDVMGYGERPLVRAEAVVLRGGVIPNLRRSGCSNHVGVDVLAVVDDGQIVFTRQTAANQLSPNLLVSSGSGSMDWSDLRRGDDLVTLVKRAMRREMLEELGIPNRERPGLEQLRVLGYARLTHLGGKPQFFGVARLRSATTSIKGIEKRYAFDHVTLDYSPAGGVRDLERAIERFESQRSPECSFTLHLNLRLLLDWLRDDPGADRWLHG